MRVEINRYQNGFGCTACGECCRHVGKNLEVMFEFLRSNGVSKRHIKFPYKLDDNGKCEKLGDDGKCTVYDKRPNICRSEWILKMSKMNVNDFYDGVVDNCNKLMDENNVDKIFRIKKFLIDK